MSRQCAAIKPDGERCRGVAIRGSDHCAAHDPSTQARRRAGAVRGGKSSGDAEIKALKGRLNELIDDVLDGRQEKGRAAVVVQACNALRSVLELQRKIREADELEERIARLEEAAEQTEQKGGRSWAT